MLNNNIEMYSTHSEGKSVVAERFIRTLNDKTYKYMASISKNVYIDKLDDKYNKTYQRTIKMKPVDVNPSMYIDFNKENNGQDPKFKIGDIVRTSEYKNCFAEGCVPNWPEEVFMIKKVKNTVSWTYFIIDSKSEETVGTFYEKELKKTNPNLEFRVEKVIKNIGNKLYVKWKGYDNYFNSWIDKKRHSIND